ncbi:GDSL-type esterase/lipase family protein [Marinomonas sp.]
MSTTDNTPLAIQACPQEAEWWLPRHQQKQQEKSAMESVNLVFLGDSITHAWEDKGLSVWQEYYQPRGALNLGFSGDRTEHVLWRIANGELDGIAPKVLVLLVGTNNTGHRQDPAEETALGVKCILEQLKERLPTTKILLLAVFPRSAKPTQKLRCLNDKINTLVEKFADEETVFYRDLSALFLDREGYLSGEVMADYLHPNASQYPLWASAIEVFLQKHL